MWDFSRLTVDQLGKFIQPALAHRYLLELTCIIRIIITIWLADIAASKQESLCRCKNTSDPRSNRRWISTSLSPVSIGRQVLGFVWNTTGKIGLSSLDWLSLRILLVRRQVFTYLTLASKLHFIFFIHKESIDYTNILRVGCVFLGYRNAVSELYHDHLLVPIAAVTRLSKFNLIVFKYIFLLVTYSCQYEKKE